MSSRRRFLQIGGAAAAGGATVSCTCNKSSWRCFTVQEAATLEAVCEQLIPSDRDPGAAWAGVVKFIDLQLLGPYKHLQGNYRAGLAKLVGFAGLPADKQLEALTRLEKSDKPFFDMVLAHTMQGYYGSPRHGGNREAVSWRMLGVPPVPVRGRA